MSGAAAVVRRLNPSAVLRRLRLRAPATAVTALLLGWLALIVLANPTGAFPLNDDWSYSRAVERLVDHGELTLTGWTSMTLLFQLMWGALFCLPFGFSFLALRLATATLGALGVLATYCLLREFRVDHRAALVGATIVALNPLYFSLSLTFMTDVPFVAASVGSLLFFSRALRTEAKKDIALGFAFAAAALLIRQPGVLLAVAFAVAYLVKHGLGRRSVAYALMPAGVVVSLLYIYPEVVGRTIGLPPAYIHGRELYRGLIDAASQDWLDVVTTVADRLLVEGVYLGALLIPLAILLVVDSWDAARMRARIRAASAGLAVVAGAGALLVWHGHVMPLSGNVLWDIGLGPPLLRDTYLLGLPHLPKAPHALWVAVTLAGVGAAVSLIGQFRFPRRVGSGSGAHRPVLEPRILLVLLVCIGYFLGTAVATASPQYAFFDRYVILLVPPLLTLLMSAHWPVGRGPCAVAIVTAAVALFVFGSFAVGATHDYLAWNRARWHALDALQQRDVPPRTIDGGFEFNGWYGFDPTSPLKTPRLWWHRGKEYLISLGPVEGYSEVERYRYRRWVPFGHGNILVLRRAGRPDRRPVVFRR